MGSDQQTLVERSGGGRARRDKAQKRQSVVIEVSGEKLRVSPESFVQGNALLWQALASEVCAECLTDREGAVPTRFAELYSGIGFFTLPLARRGLSGVALESDRSALADLAYNLRQAELAERVEVLSGRVESRGDLADRIKSADLLLVDPPRIGLDPRVRSAVAASGPARCVYVSCDPATLARDLRELCEGGYSIASLKGFDLFPQTPHVETLVRLERR
jgi:23S rRNA (uracil1939-C5)-methyltransferase